jgi:hypothetical protein
MADDRQWYENAATAEQRRMLDRKYRVALILYAILAALSWFTLDGKVPIGGRLVELRLIPLLIIGGLALRTMLAMKAEKIRREGEKGSR